VKSLLDRADACLYNAKAAGRNRTCRESDLDTATAVEPGVGEEEKIRISESNGLYHFSDRVEVSTSLEITAMKLRAFISEHRGVVVDQEKGKMQIRLGTPGFFGHWGKTTARQPVDLQISFETTRNARSPHEKIRTHRLVTVEIHSQGKVPGMDHFAARCLSLMRDLKAFLQGS
jgi:hypothetical protein